MQKTYKVKGIIGENTLSSLAMELGCTIEAKKMKTRLIAIIESKEVKIREVDITIFDERQDIETVFAKFGLQILEIISNTQ